MIEPPSGGSIFDHPSEHSGSNIDDNLQVGREREFLTLFWRSSSKLAVIAGAAPDTWGSVKDRLKLTSLP
jgi:hypothetical protein